MRVVGAGLLAIAVAAAGCSRNPMVKRERLTPKPMKVAFAGFAVNRFYALERDEISVIPVTNVVGLYATFRDRISNQTLGRFAFVEDAVVRANDPYHRRAVVAGPSRILESARSAAPEGMMQPRPTEMGLARELCRELGVDAVLWASLHFTQVKGFAIGGVGEFKLEGRGEIMLVGNAGKIWRDVVTLTSERSFAGVRGVALPGDLNRASSELAGRISTAMAERLRAKAPPESP